jgi:hypothetical protein
MYEGSEIEACGSILGSGSMLQDRKSLDIFFFFFNLLNPSSCAVALGLTYPLTEMSTRNLPGG